MAAQTMSTLGDLEKLVALREAGELTGEEFSYAKQRLLQGRPESLSLGANPPVDNLQSGEQVFHSSRWSEGNRLFPDSITLAKDGVLFCKRRLFGSNEEHINYRAVASCRVTNGIFLSKITIETAGGSQPIYINGLWKAEAKTILEVVRSRQEG